MHEVVAVATSLQLFSKVDLQTVLKSGRCLSRELLLCFCLKDVYPQADHLPRLDLIASGWDSGGGGHLSLLGESYNSDFPSWFSWQALSSTRFFPLKEGGAAPGPSILVSMENSSIEPFWVQNRPNLSVKFCQISILNVIRGVFRIICNRIELSG